MDRRTFIKALGVLGGLGIGAGSWAQGSRADATAGAEIRPRPQSAWRAVVVGAGVAGLAAARTLAEAGWEVDVLEKDLHPGGFCSTLVIDGFRFDLGPHVFHPMIRPLVGFQPSDLDAATFSESFLINGKLLNFPRDLLSHGYMLDIMGTLARNAINPERLNSRDMETLAAASYGEKAGTEIFKPLIEKWCRAPLSRLDSRYFASRMHSKLQMDSVAGYLRSTYSQVERTVSDLWGGNHETAHPLGPDGIPDAPGYSGRTGARIVPDRLAAISRAFRIRCNCPVTAIGVQKGRIEWLEAAGSQIRPDFVISTAPLNRFASMIEGSDALMGLADLHYLHVVFVFVRIKRNGLLKTEWTWVPERGVPFYRVSEMKVLNKDHAPENFTGLCLEVTVAEEDSKFHEPDQYWKDLALNFLEKTFSVLKSDIVGLDVVKRQYAYPDFTIKNTRVISKCLSDPYTSGQPEHRFRTGIENLALAGRAGTFIYLLTPWAIMSGQRAARQAIEYAAGKAKAKPVDA